jgi:hypothetical protein
VVCRKTFKKNYLVEYLYKVNSDSERLQLLRRYDKNTKGMHMCRGHGLPSSRDGVILETACGEVHFTRGCTAKRS